MGSKLALNSAIAFVVVVFIGIATIATSQPIFCKTCHEMRNDYGAWSSSNHAKATCNACHVGPSTVKLLIHKVGSLFKETPSHFLSLHKGLINEKSEVSREIPSENCLECHVIPKKNNFNNLIFKHTKHKHLNCAFCHNRVGHPGLNTYKNRATMVFCLNCHKNNNAATTCLTCHTPSIMQRPVTHWTSDWIKVHKSRVDLGCFFCHKKVHCMACHTNLRLPAGLSKVEQ